VTEPLPLLIALTAIVGLALLWVRRHSPGASLHTVRVDDLPRILEQLTRHGSEGDFAGFLVRPCGDPRSKDTLSLQFSIEGGRVGLDWLLVRPDNILKQAQFEELAQDLGYSVSTRKMDDVPYLRVEDGDVAKLGIEAIRGLCILNPLAEIQLVAEGFRWPPVG